MTREELYLAESRSISPSTRTSTQNTPSALTASENSRSAHTGEDGKSSTDFSTTAPASAPTKFARSESRESLSEESQASRSCSSGHSSKSSTKGSSTKIASGSFVRAEPDSSDSLVLSAVERLSSKREARPLGSQDSSPTGEAHSSHLGAQFEESFASLKSGSSERFSAETPDQESLSWSNKRQKENFLDEDERAPDSAIAASSRTSRSHVDSKTIDKDREVSLEEDGTAKAEYSAKTVQRDGTEMLTNGTSVNNKSEDPLGDNEQTSQRSDSVVSLVKSKISENVRDESTISHSHRSNSPTEEDEEFSDLTTKGLLSWQL